MSKPTIALDSYVKLQKECDLLKQQVSHADKSCELQNQELKKENEELRKKEVIATLPNSHRYLFDMGFPDVESALEHITKLINKLKIAKLGLMPFSNQAEYHHEFEDKPLCCNCGEAWPCDFEQAKEAIKQIGDE